MILKKGGLIISTKKWETRNKKIKKSSINNLVTDIKQRKKSKNRKIHYLNQESSKL